MKNCCSNRRRRRVSNNLLQALYEASLAFRPFYEAHLASDTAVLGSSRNLYLSIQEIFLITCNRNMVESTVSTTFAASSRWIGSHSAISLHAVLLLLKDVCLEPLLVASVMENFYERNQ